MRTQKPPLPQEHLSTTPKVQTPQPLQTKDSSMLLEQRQLTVLASEHRRLLTDFTCEAEEMATYLQRFAWRHQEKDRINRTYLFLDQGRIAGYFSLAAASIERNQVEALTSAASLPRLPIPALLLTR